MSGRLGICRNADASLTLPRRRPGRLSATAVRAARRPSSSFCRATPRPRPCPHHNDRAAGPYPAAKHAARWRRVHPGACGAIEVRADDAAQAAAPVRRPEAAGAVRLVLRDGNLETEDGLPLLAGLGAGFTVTEGQGRAEGEREEEASGRLVLGLSTDESTHFVETAVGELCCSRLLSCARCKLWWMSPEWGTGASDLPPETQFLLLELAEGGPYAVLLPLICDEAFRGSLRPPGRNDSPETLVLRLESNSEERCASSFPHAFLAQASWDLFSLVDSAVAHAASLSGGSPPLSEKVLPGSLDVFGWCTWDAFYSKVSAVGLRRGLDALHRGRVPPKLLVIDDGWQQTDVDEAQRAIFGDDNMVPEEVREAERLALSSGGLEDITRQGSGSSIYAVTASVTASVEEESRLRRMRESGDPLEGDPDDFYVSGDDVERELQQQEQSLPSAAAPPPAKKVNPVFAAAGKLRRGVWYGVDVAVGWILGLGEALFLRLYQRVIEPAPPGSLPVKFFTWLANGPAKGAMLEFFCATGDFSRRLVDVTANGKFATPFSDSAGAAGGASFKRARLGQVVASLRSSYRLQFVYCWHALPGYWGGVSAESGAMSRFNPTLMKVKPMPGVLEVEPSQAWGPAALAGIGVVEDAAVLYEAMHSYLAGEGVDGVKVDCQAGIGLVPSPEGTPATSAAFQYALEASVKKHFPGNHVINCMCHDTENFYRFTSSAVARVSDDFYPRDRASHTAHIANCAYNGLFMSALVQPDWDMFQSEHPANLLHATARAASGAAVYVSDKPGKHDFDLLRRLVLPDGTVLRAELPGRPTADSVFCDVMRDGRSALKVWNRNALGALVGLFNLQGSAWDRKKRQFMLHDRKPPAVECQARPSDVPPQHLERRRLPDGVCEGCDATGSFAAFCSNGRELHRVEPGDGGIPVGLEAGESEIVTFVEFYRRSGVEFAPIGLTGMLNPGGAVLSLRCHAPTGRTVCFSVGLCGCGEFSAACSVAPVSCRFLVAEEKGEGEEEDDTGAVRARPIVLDFEYRGDKGAVEVAVPEVPGLRGELEIIFSAS